MLPLLLFPGVARSRLDRNCTITFYYAKHCICHGITMAPQRALKIDSLAKVQSLIRLALWTEPKA